MSAERFVVRAKYCQPDGVGWLTKDSSVTSDPTGAAVFDNEAEAWNAWGMQQGKHVEDGDFFVEPHRTYTAAELSEIRTAYEMARDAYYRVPDEDEDTRYSPLVE